MTVELERENPVEAPVPQQEQVLTTDPDSTYPTKGGPARLGYYDNYLVDNASCVIVGVQATPARLSQERGPTSYLGVEFLDQSGGRRAQRGTGRLKSLRLIVGQTAEIPT